MLGNVGNSGSAVGPEFDGIGLTKAKTTPLITVQHVTWDSFPRLLMISMVKIFPDTVCYCAGLTFQLWGFKAS